MCLLVDPADTGCRVVIFLFSDFGRHDPYQAQMTTVLKRSAPEIEVIDLLADAPAMDPKLAAYLLASHWPLLTPRDVMLAVIDPGVGTERHALAIEIDRRWLVGPDNGLFELVLRRHDDAHIHHIDWRPAELSSSFHGRDLFAPVAADLARGTRAFLSPAEALRFPDWSDDLQEVIYIDHYGNAFTGMRASTFDRTGLITINGHTLRFARTFAEAEDLFWYENSVGLVEIAGRNRSAAQALNLTLGTAFTITN